MPLDEPTIHRIYLVRQMLAEGLDTANDALPFTRMRSVLTLDHAVELLLSTSLSRYGITMDNSWTLPKMLDELANRQPGLAALTPAMKEWRKTRDRVQHSGLIPSAESVRLMRIEVESLVRAAVRAVFDKELEQFTLTALLTNVQARSHLEQAEVALAATDFKTTINEAAIAFAFGRQQLSNPRFHWSDPAKMIVDGLVGAVSRAVQTSTNADIVQFANALQRELTNATELKYLTVPERHYVEALTLGIDVGAYDRFQDVTPFVYIAPTGEPTLWDFRQQAPSQADALFALDFATTTLLQLQSRLPAVEPPTGGPTHA